MKRTGVEIIIYGAEQICASCFHLPSSKDTYEWLEAAISRKFPGQPFGISYVDLYNPPNEADSRHLLKGLLRKRCFFRSS